jgi:hypothetical protein
MFRCRLALTRASTCVEILRALTQLNALAWHYVITRMISRMLENLPHQFLQVTPGYNQLYRPPSQEASGSIMIAVLEVPDSHSHQHSEQPNIYLVFPQSLEGNYWDAIQIR